MLRITQLTAHDGIPTLKVEGKLLGPWVAELQRACGELQKTGAHPALDLSAVTFADGAGVKLLHDLLAQGITLTACSGLVAQLLQVKDR